MLPIHFTFCLSEVWILIRKNLKNQTQAATETGSKSPLGTETYNLIRKHAFVLFIF